MYCTGISSVLYRNEYIALYRNESIALYRDKFSILYRDESSVLCRNKSIVLCRNESGIPWLLVSDGNAPGDSAAGGTEQARPGVPGIQEQD